MDDSPGRPKALLAIAAITIIGMIAAVYGAFASGTEEKLTKAAHDVVASECARAYLQLRALPPLVASINTTTTDRATLTRRENTIFATMVDGFTAAKPTNTSGKVALAAWIQDWRSLIDRRAKYADDLISTRDHAELVITKDDQGAPITNRMNEFSRTHALIGCETHNLQAETVDGVRSYPSDPTKVP